MNHISNELMDKLTQICLCKGVSRATIKKAILNGADTVEKVWKETNAGHGGCSGRRCAPKIEELIKTMKEQENSM